ncbi:PBP superfamily domain protein [Pelotomaculum schinkii]|uniref:PBP superfamily domain protein n=1 Tax=Pelotomaculum schinkii TaxID=78350 RepID=A0A4Y7R759_9FIRM|nr:MULTISPECIES: helix-turn-helix transcriptional regulator [Pelotomaculum]TEB04559.1 PBP superfamily domain protein [Pelotomaculum schinkii]TEB15040.1 PBP superfamily domain protein [Pelotomaculum sp. FP]
MKEDSSLTPEEVASTLKIAKNTVYELIKRGELAAYRVGRKIRVDQKDVEAYKNLGKKLESTAAPYSAAARSLPATAPDIEEPSSNLQRIVICGQDVLLDILARHLERHPNGVGALRHHVGSFNGLLALYQGKVHMTAVHLWAGERDLYNIPYVRRLLPGIPTLIVHLACRMQGFYVAKGNPKGIKSWQDLTRPGIRFINREKGSGTRVLLNEQFRLLGLDSSQINGYETEELSHLTVASAVARGEADVGLGIEKVSLQARGIDFVPLQKERYELVMKKEDADKPQFQAVLEIIQSHEFKKELLGLGDYDVTETGKIVAEV